jgi:Ion channel
VDAVSTLITTRRRSSRLWPTNVFYRRTWRVWRALGLRIASEHRREQFLAAYGPLSLLGLLLVWVLLMVTGWGLVWWALRSQLGVDGYLDAVYFAGVGFFTVGYGDIVPTGDLARQLTLVQAFIGVGTMALVIGFLPTLFGAYSRREVQLLTLDDLSDGRTTPAGFIETQYTGGGLDALAAAFADWERWCADVFDSHTAYPMLMLFRSRQPGQHWLAALGVVTDAAAISLAAVQGAQAGPALRLYRCAARLWRTLTLLPAVGQRAADRSDQLGDEQRFQVVYQRLAGHGVPMRPYEQAWADVRRLRTVYVPNLLAMADLFLIPLGLSNQPRP